MLFQSGEFKLMRVTCDFVCCFWLKLQSFLDNEPYSNSAAENISYLLYIKIRFLLMCCFTSHTYSKYKGPFCTGKIKISVNENDMNKRWEWCWHSSAGLLLQYVAFHPEWLSFVQVKIAAWMVGGGQVTDREEQQCSVSKKTSMVWCLPHRHHPHDSPQWNTHPTVDRNATRICWLCCLLDNNEPGFHFVTGV